MKTNNTIQGHYLTFLSLAIKTINETSSVKEVVSLCAVACDTHLQMFSGEQLSAAKTLISEIENAARNRLKTLEKEAELNELYLLKEDLAAKAAMEKLSLDELEMHANAIIKLSAERARMPIPESEALWVQAIRASDYKAAKEAEKKLGI